MIALEIGYDQAEAVETMLGDNEFIDIKTHNDLSGVARFPIAKLPGSPPPTDQAEDSEESKDSEELQADTNQQSHSADYS